MKNKTINEIVIPNAGLDMDVVLYSLQYRE
jgi:hypothetical protein